MAPWSLLFLDAGGPGGGRGYSAEEAGNLS
jgi:hypothetical protein